MRGAALLLAAVGLTGCLRSIALNDDPTFPRRDARVSPQRLFDVEWWRGYVKPGLLEYQPSETAKPAVDLDTERIFIATRDGTLRCVSPIDGATEWELPAFGHAFAGPTVRDGKVFAPGGNGSLYALRSLTGEKLWVYPAGEDLVTSPVLAQGKVLVASQSDTLFAIDAETGKWIWQYRRDPPSGFTVRGASAPAVADGVVYMGFSDGTLVALGLDDGVARWERKVSVSGGTQFLDVDTTPVVDEDRGRVYVASYKDGVAALKASNGEVLWSAQRSGVTSLLLRGSVLFTGGDGVIGAHDVAKGHLLWSLDLSDKGSKVKTNNSGRAPTLVAGYLVVPTSTGLAFVDPATGQVISAWNPGKGVTATPTRVSSPRLGNRLYVLSNGGSLFALQMVSTGG